MKRRATFMCLTVFVGQVHVHDRFQSERAFLLPWASRKSVRREIFSKAKKTRLDLQPPRHRQSFMSWRRIRKKIAFCVRC